MPYIICMFNSVWKSHQNAPFEQSFFKKSAFHSELTLCLSFQFTLCVCLVVLLNLLCGITTYIFNFDFEWVM